MLEKDCTYANFSSNTMPGPRPCTPKDPSCEQFWHVRLVVREKPMENCSVLYSGASCSTDESAENRIYALANEDCK